ncbi:hypothetical protein JQX13_19575 [Archangium violaceum]|uniref:DUF5666 domain-containing protein n=1 Tax=Archangium violaceum TaxID=83451 RepID=UPI00193B3776|nr:DUF5666 domain-containing protein [Archangium violaceum]QRK12048.1 hypothetical protein JQX13_19575 [Archangium violaceum]
MTPHKWTWSLTAVALLGLASGCSRDRTDPGRLDREKTVQQGTEGDRTPMADSRQPEQSPLITGGEDLADQEIYGTVTGVAGNSLTVRNPTGSTTLTLTLDDNTRFVRQGQQADRGQLQEGMQVRASYDEDGGRYEATTVELLQDASAPQKP